MQTNRHNASNRDGHRPVAMRRLLAIAAVCVLAAAAGSAWADGPPPRDPYRPPPRDPFIPYIYLTATPDHLDLGAAPGQGTYDSPAELKITVNANYLHGGVAASITTLTRTGGGGEISVDRIYVRKPTGDYVPMTATVNLTGPMNPGIFNIIVKFRVITTMADNPGDYAGTVTVTLAPLP